MERKGEKGSITVFLSLACILFLCLICSAVESARMQGAKAQTANITGMGTFSVLGEFENALLDEYDIFALDGAYGSGAFGIEKAEERFRFFLDRNAHPKEGVLAALCFDPWRLEVEEGKISEYALLTDEKGEAFYQQAVSFMKINAASLAIEALLDSTKNTEKIQKWEEEYKERKKENETSLKELEDQKKEKREALESEAAEAGMEAAVPQKGNPLEEIARLRKKSLLAIVTGDAAISDRRLSASRLPSGGRNRKGSMKLEKKTQRIAGKCIVSGIPSAAFSELLQ